MSKQDNLRIILRRKDVPQEWNNASVESSWGDGIVCLLLPDEDGEGLELLTKLETSHPDLTIMAEWNGLRGAYPSGVYARDGGRTVEFAAFDCYPVWEFLSPEKLPDETWMDDVKFFFQVRQKMGL